MRTDTAAYTDAVNAAIAELTDTDEQYMAAVRMADNIEFSGDPSADAAELVDAARDADPAIFDDGYES